MTDMVFQGKWNQLKGEVKKQWAKLTDDDVDALQGEGEKLIGKLQERYGYTKQQAEQEVTKFMKRFDKDS